MHQGEISAIRAHGTCAYLIVGAARVVEILQPGQGNCEVHVGRRKIRLQVDGSTERAAGRRGGASTQKKGGRADQGLNKQAIQDGIAIVPHAGGVATHVRCGSVAVITYQVGVSTRLDIGSIKLIEIYGFGAVARSLTHPPFARS